MLPGQKITRRTHAAIVFLRKTLTWRIRPSPMRDSRGLHRVKGRGNYTGAELLTLARNLGWKG